LKTKYKMWVEGYWLSISIGPKVG